MGRTEKLFEKLMGRPERCELFVRRTLHAADKGWLCCAQGERQPLHLSARIELLNLQPTAGGKAKSYQVRQARKELKNLNLKP